MDNPRIIDKTYYHCTKKNKKYKCSQRSIEEADLQEQIEKLLSTISIGPEFHKWAIDTIKEIHGQETYEQDAIVGSIKKKETELRNRLQSLVIMRANGEISSDELKELRSQTDEDLHAIHAELSGIHTRASEWVKVANDYLNFAVRAVEKFKHGDNETKRAILSALGSKPIILGKKLYISIPKPLLDFKETQDKVIVSEGWFENQKIPCRTRVFWQKNTYF